VPKAEAALKQAGTDFEARAHELKRLQAELEAKQAALPQAQAP
jgi:hypothetical protein